METRPCLISVARLRLKAAASPSWVKPTGSQKPTGSCTPSSLSKARTETWTFLFTCAGMKQTDPLAPVDLILWMVSVARTADMPSIATPEADEASVSADVNSECRCKLTRALKSSTMAPLKRGATKVVHSGTTRKYTARAAATGTNTEYILVGAID